MKINNFDGVRIGLALIVVFAHLAALTQIREFEAFEKIFDSNFAVKGFFTISGFLVTKSYLSSRSLVEYAEKRFRRIYPGYLGIVIFCIFIGSCVTSLDFPHFISSPITWKYTFSNLAFLNFIQPSLPFVFDSNPIKAIDGALWTIKVEVMLYFCIPLIIYLFNRVGSRIAFLGIFFTSIAWVYFFTYIFEGSGGEEIARQFPGQLSFFAFGALLSVDKKIASHLKWIGLVAIIAMVCISNHYARLVIDPIAYGAIVIYLATANFSSFNIGRFGDISYGVYLYHFPIIQLLIFLEIFRANALVGLLLTFLLTFLASLVSWHFIEKRFLKRSSHYLNAERLGAGD